MKVLDCIKNGKGRTTSIEIEPPKLGYSREDLLKTIDPLAKLGIKYIHITHHSPSIVDYIHFEGKKLPMYQRLHPGTSGIAGAILKRYAKYRVFPIPHLICTGLTQYDTEDFLHELACLGIQNILALRGDGKKNEHGSIMPFQKQPGGHRYANELIHQISQLKQGKYLKNKTGTPLNFEIGAACYPEGHPESLSMKSEIQHLKTKASMGAEYFVTQMFYDCNVYETFINHTTQLGIHQPIIPGIKPITNYKHLKTLPKIFGCKIPKKLQEQVECYKNNHDDIRKVGIEWCVKQSLYLRALKAPSLHFYASRNAPIKEVIEILNKT